MRQFWLPCAVSSLTTKVNFCYVLIMKLRLSALFWLGYFFFPATVFAYDPLGLQPISPYGIFSVMSAETLHQHKLALEVSTEKSKHPDFYRFGLKGAYGLTDAIELDFMAPFVYRYSEDANGIEDSSGLEDFSVGFRHRFYDEGKYGPSLAYLLTAALGSGRDQFSTNGRIGAGLIASKRIGPFKGHLNALFQKPGTSRLKSEITFSGGIDFSASNNINMLGEIIVRKDHTTQRYNDIETRVGYRIKTLDFMYTTVGVGFDLKNKTPEYRLLLSVSLTSPVEKKEIRRIYEEE